MDPISKIGIFKKLIQYSFSIDSRPFFFFFLIDLTFESCEIQPWGGGGINFVWHTVYVIYRSRSAYVETLWANSSLFFTGKERANMSLKSSDSKEKIVLLHNIHWWNHDTKPANGRFVHFLRFQGNFLLRLGFPLKRKPSQHQSASRILLSCCRAKWRQCNIFSLLGIGTEINEHKIYSAYLPSCQHR